MKEKDITWAPRLISALFLIILFAAGAGIFLFQRESSEIENRELQQLPSPDAGSVLSGEWQKEFEDFTSDQFPFRDDFNAFGVTVRYALGNRLIGGAYIGKTPDGSVRLFEEKADDEKRASRVSDTLAAADAFSRACGIPTTLLIAPSSGDVYYDDTPSFAPPFDLVIKAEAKKSHDCAVIYPSFPTASDDESLYFRTDHHWTARGAFLAYREYADETGLTPINVSFELLSDSFYGTLHSKAPLPFITPDVLEKSDVDVSGVRVSAGGGFGGMDSLSEIQLYSEAALEIKDKYQYFLGGNYGLTVIESPADGGTLFIFKDSFANCFVPYLTTHYSRIIMIDPRYYRGSYTDLAALFDETAPDRVLILYESANLADDTYLAPMLNALAGKVG